MKFVYKNGWIAKLGGVVLASMLAVPSYAQLMLAHEGHHDAGGCTIKTGEFPVTFSAYEVPEGGIPPMHSFCENLPNTGKVNLTIELPQQAREMMLAVRLVKDGHEGHGAKPDAAGQKNTGTEANHQGHEEHEGMSHDEHAGHGAADEHGVVYMPAQEHGSGIIVVAANIQEKGAYAIQLERKDDAGNVKTVVKIPLNVGKGGGHGSHGGGFGLMEIALIVLAGGGAAAFYFMRKKKASGTAA